MLKLNRLRGNLLVFLLMFALCPLVFRQLLTVFIQAEGCSGPEVSVSHSARRCYGKVFLHQLNCQTLESVRENQEPKTEAGLLPKFPEIGFLCRLTAKTVSVVFAEKLSSSDGSIPLRI